MGWVLLPFGRRQDAVVAAERTAGDEDGAIPEEGRHLEVVRVTEVDEGGELGLAPVAGHHVE